MIPLLERYGIPYTVETAESIAPCGNDGQRT
jgi:hypothetical protein